jgi:hypothetical protein
MMVPSVSNMKHENQPVQNCLSQCFKTNLTFEASWDPKYQSIISVPVHDIVEHKKGRKLLIKINRPESVANNSL